MPRARKTQSGANAMSTQQVPGQQYGKGVEQEALQRAMPAPQTASVSSVVPPSSASAPVGPGAAPPPAAPTPSAPSDPAAAFAALRDKVGLLGQATARPDEPITAGLDRGPGPGSEVLGATFGSPIGNTLRTLASQLGDPYFAQLAERAGM